ncbi:unnamed protein product [Ostreobium quekettii]|uniref:Uncharacterized protein n=1 Tax=Ostreobium quekettii TaxID=121088 RepID=A0A8S1IKS5_9CHLO|nr:unnamed protein product [Ostreobium quekettii]|eukprot:evm.model.scf_255EXC.1 EVM.evm.TU.scf_255EXC.1   scf_255EXC:3342-11349(+)
MAATWARRGPQGKQYNVSVRDAANWLRDYLTAIRHGQFHPFTPIERKAREATRNEAWGPTGTVLHELAEATMQSEYCQIIYAVVEARLKYPADKWRNVYKGLQVLEFLIKRGSDECVMIAQADLRPYVENVRNLEYIGPDGRDYGINVRVRADAIVRLLDNDQELKHERAQLRRRAQQFRGYSKQEMENHEGFGDLPPRSNSWAGRTQNTEGTGREACNSNDERQVARSRRPGEMKGVSESENKKQLRQLKQLLSSKSNRRCSDCLGEDHPSWASINCGVFLCMKCAGIHRGLGVHVSQVRSCTLDTWLPEQVKFMMQTGNRVANSYWEAKLPPNLKPGPDDPNLGKFIRRKYENREWADGPWPPARDALQNENVRPEPSGTSDTSVTSKSSLRIAKHPSMRSTKPPRGRSKQGRRPADSQFTESADSDATAGGHSDWVSSPASDQHGMRPASATPQMPLASVAMNSHQLQGQGIPRTSSFPDEDLVRFSNSGDGDFCSTRTQDNQYQRQGGQERRVQMLDMLYDTRGSRQQGFTRDTDGVIKTTELECDDDEEEAVIHTTELNLDDLDAGPARPALASADGILQSGGMAEYSSIPWLDGMQEMKGSPCDRPLQASGISAGQKRDERRGSGGRRSATPDSQGPHVSVTIKFGNGLGAVGAPSGSQAHPQTVTLPGYAHNSMGCARPSAPVYQQDRPHSRCSAASAGASRDPPDDTSSRGRNVEEPALASWDSQHGALSAVRPHSNNPFADPASSEAPYLSRVAEMWATASAPGGSPTAHSPACGSVNQHFGLQRRGSVHGVVMGVPTGKRREDGEYVADRSLGVQSSQSPGRPHRTGERAQSSAPGGVPFAWSSGSGFKQGGPAHRNVRRTAGAEGSSSDASEEVERMQYSQVEMLGLQGEKYRARGSGAYHSSQRRLAEMKGHRVGTSSGSGSG